VQAEVDGERLTDLELNLFFVTLVVAGNETTRNLISHGMLALIEHPDQLRRLREDPGLWPTAVEEMLRWGTSIHNFRRTATRDTELRGQRIAAGDKVVMYYMSANRDEEVFEDPFRFDVGRTPNDHVAFGGGGVHYCLGASLARAEIRELMRQLVERLDDAQLAGEVRRTRSDFGNGTRSMPVTFRARGVRVLGRPPGPDHGLVRRLRRGRGARGPGAGRPGSGSRPRPRRLSWPSGRRRARPCRGSVPAAGSRGGRSGGPPRRCRAGGRTTAPAPADRRPAGSDRHGQHRHRRLPRDRDRLLRGRGARAGGPVARRAGRPPRVLPGRAAVPLEPGAALLGGGPPAVGAARPGAAAVVDARPG